MKKTILPFLLLFLIFQSISCSKEDTAAKSGSTKNGTLSRVISIGNYIYAVDDNHLITINAGDPANLSIENNISLGANIQTIYHHNGSLFIGSATQMYIYNIQNNPAAPSLTSTFTYPVLIEPRDPILTLDSVIYSTSTSEGWSGFFSVFDSRDITNPVLLEQNSLQTPRGMDVSGNYLYVCNGRFGIWIYSITDPFHPTLESIIDENNILANGEMGTNDYYDVIAENGQLFCYTKGALLNYNISQPNQPIFLNKIQ
jgi:hypothetical protein